MRDELRLLRLCRRPARYAESEHWARGNPAKRQSLRALDGVKCSLLNPACPLMTEHRYPSAEVAAQCSGCRVCWFVGWFVVYRVRARPSRLEKLMKVHESA